MNAHRPRARYERSRTRTRRQLHAGISSSFGWPAPVHPEDSALVNSLTGAITGPGKDPGDDCETRDGIRADGLPAEHPESMVLGLSPADEVGLAALSTDLWPPAAVLSDAQRETLGHALGDGLAYREWRASATCRDCAASPADLCDDHAADLDRTDAYLALARDLGIEVPR